VYTSIRLPRLLLPRPPNGPSTGLPTKSLWTALPPSGASTAAAPRSVALASRLELVSSFPLPTLSAHAPSFPKPVTATNTHALSIAKSASGRLSRNVTCPAASASRAGSARFSQKPVMAVKTALRPLRLKNATPAHALSTAKWVPGQFGMLAASSVALAPRSVNVKFCASPPLTAPYALPSRKKPSALTSNALFPARSATGPFMVSAL